MPSLYRRTLNEGVLRGPSAIDYFIFPHDLYRRMPPLALGRAYFDNWMIWAAKRYGGKVVDATQSVLAIHQAHDYQHLVGGRDTAYLGEEAKANMRLAGGRRHCHNLLDASHRLTDKGVLPNFQRWFQWRRLSARCKDHAWYAIWAMLGITRPLRHALGLRRSTLDAMRGSARSLRSQDA
jgi:hypothetical protein